MSTKNVEKAFNLFFFTETEVIKELGAVVHEIAENDSEIVDFLRRAVSQDYLRCKRYPIPKRLHKLNSDGSLNYSSYIALSRVGRDLELFEDIFIEHNASATPLCCVTPIVQGIPTIDIITDHSPFMYGDYQGHPKIGPGVMKDYLQESGYALRSSDDKFQPV